MDTTHHIVQGNTIKYHYKGDSSKLDVINAIADPMMDDNKLHSKCTDPSRQINLAKVQNQRENMMLKERINQLNREGAHRLTNIANEQKLFKKKQQSLNKSKSTVDHSQAYANTTNHQDNHDRHEKDNLHQSNNLPSIAGRKICQEKTWLVVDYDHCNSSHKDHQDIKRNTTSTDIMLLPLENQTKHLIASGRNNVNNTKTSTSNKVTEITVKMPPIETNYQRNNLNTSDQESLSSQRKRSSIENLPALISNQKELSQSRALANKRDGVDNSNHRKNNTDAKDESNSIHYQSCPQINKSNNLSGKLTKADLKKNDNLRKMMEELSKCTYLRHPNCNADTAAFPSVLEIQSKPVWTLTG